MELKQLKQIYRFLDGELNNDEIRNLINTCDLNISYSQIYEFFQTFDYEGIRAFVDILKSFYDLDFSVKDLNHIYNSLKDELTTVEIRKVIQNLKNQKAAFEIGFFFFISQEFYDSSQEFYEFRFNDLKYYYFRTI